MSRVQLDPNPRLTCPIRTHSIHQAVDITGDIIAYVIDDVITNVIDDVSILTHSFEPSDSLTRDLTRLTRLLERVDRHLKRR